jgi:glc operon protein GlcG
MADATKRNMKMAIAIVEPSGDLVYFRRMDGTQYASIQIAQDKAKSAALFHRSSKDFLDRVAKGDMSPFALRGAVASAGGDSNRRRRQDHRRDRHVGRGGRRGVTGRG